MKKINIAYLVIAILLGMTPGLVNAQSDTNLKTITGTITDKTGNKIANVAVMASGSEHRTFTDKDGFFEINTETDDFIIVSREGFEKSVITVKDGAIAAEIIIMDRWDVMNAQEKIQIAHGELPFERVTGSIERITGEELKDYPTVFLQEALAGRLSGLYAVYGDASPEVESFGNVVRGSSFGEIYVDGVPSNLVLNPREVDDVIIAKDYGSSFLYGGTAAGGAMIVNTKRGIPGERLMRFTVRGGLRTPTFIPDMMNAQDYARHYNMALSNDGFAPIYSQETIDAYTNGTDSIRNPNNDYYRQLVDDPANYKHITGDFSGGGEKVQYFTHLGYYTATGIESVGSGRNIARLRLNNNVQMKFSEYGSINLGIGGSFNRRKAPLLNGNSMFNTMYEYPANALPYQINDTVYARTPEFNTNLLVGLAHGSVIEDTRRDAFARIGLDLDLGSITQGLSFSVLGGLYTYNNLSRRLDPSVDMAEPFFTQTASGADTLILRNVSRGAPDNVWGTLGDRVDRSQFVNANFKYRRNFNDNHQVMADLIYTQRRVSGSQLNQEERLRNIGLRVNYFINKKYVVEGNVMNSAVRQLSKEERNKLSYAGGLAWLAHKESFLADASWLTFLKVRANYGILGEPVSSFFLTDDQYTGSGAGGSFGIVGNNSSAGGHIRILTGSGNIKLPRRQYLNVGADFQLFDNKITGQINYFNIRRTDQLVLPGNLYALLSSNASYMPFMNYSDSEQRGIDTRISYHRTIGNIEFTVSANATRRVSYISKDNSVVYPEADRNRIGNKGDRIIGLEADGIFQNQAEIEAAPLQMFGEVKPGDIRYRDHNGDGVVDEKDYHEIGHLGRIIYGFSYRMRYKGWSLGIYADGITGGSFIDSRQWRPGMKDYTAEMAKSWPASNDLPRLTTLNNDNNYRTSTFWMRNVGFLNLRSVTLSYTLPPSILQNTVVRDASVFIAGKNLLTVSSVDDQFMPNQFKGYEQHPVLNAFEVGLEVSF